MKRSYERRLLVKQSIVQHLHEGENIVSAIYKANGLECDDLPKGNYADEEYFIGRFTKSKGHEARSLSDVVGSIQYLRDNGHIGSDIQNLLAGHSFEYLRTLIQKRHSRRIGKELRVKYLPEFEVFWNERFGHLTNLKYTTQVANLAFLHIPQKKGVSIKESLKGFAAYRECSSVEVDWSLLARQDMTPSGGLKMFLKDMLVNEPIPESVNISAKFKDLGDQPFRVKYMSGVSVIVELNKRMSPFQLHFMWPNFMSELNSLLDEVSKMNGFASLLQWVELSASFPKKSIKSMQDYARALENKNRVDQVAGVVANKKRAIKTGYIDASLVAELASKDLDSFAQELILLNAAAKNSELVSSRDRRSLYVMKRRLILILLNHGHAKITKLCKRQNELELTSDLFLSDLELGQVLLPMIFQKRAKIMKGRTPILKNLVVTYKANGWNQLLQSDNLLSAIGASFKAECESWAAIYGEQAIWGARRAVGSNKLLVTLLDHSRLGEGVLSKLEKSGDDESMFRSGFYDVYEFAIGENLFHLPKDIIPEHILTQMSDLPSEEYPLGYKFGSGDLSGCNTISRLKEVLVNLGIDWSRWKFSVKLAEKIENC